MAGITAIAGNFIRQTTAPDVKVFFIGFNKCGTTSCHGLMKGAGIRAVHWRNGQQNIAEEIEMRLPDLTALKAFLARWTSYTDLISASPERVIEGNRHFRLFHELFPNAYFVLNDRDLDAWLLSRERHAEGRFLRQSMAFHETDREGVRALWRELYERHTAAVLDHFAGSPRFLHFHIDREPVDRLIDFLSADFTLSASDWRVRNKTRSAASA